MVAVVLNGLVHLVLVEVLDGSLVPAERPEGRQLGSANDSMILLNHLLCRAENEEVYLQLATKGDVAEYRLVRLGIVDLMMGSWALLFLKKIPTYSWGFLV